ncbi:hypothetical protein C8R46DRAFT_1216915 [Mycena filopes]|nr:hypothetical protein C8R46DRAFT_1216915 [Mycena filopes]
MKFATAISAAIALNAAALVSGATVTVKNSGLNTTQAGNAPNANGGGVTPNPDAAPFAINIGENKGQGNMVAWVAGQSKCTAVVIGPIGANFCGRDFVLKNPATGNGITFVAEGCGESPFWITQVSKGGIYAYCTSYSEGDACGVDTFWHCV